MKKELDIIYYLLDEIKECNENFLKHRKKQEKIIMQESEPEPYPRKTLIVQNARKARQLLLKIVKEAEDYYFQGSKT